MKKLFFSLMSMFFVFTAVGQQESFDAVTTDGCIITYEVTGENTVKVYAFERDYEGAVTIPSIVTYESNEYTVTAIGAFAGQGGGSMEDGGPTHEEWYDYHNYITSVFIPNTVETIETFAFVGCNYSSEITQITFEENSNLTTIVDYAFTGCNYLTEITIPASVSYWGQFEGTGLQHVYFEEPSSLTEFPEYMFYGVPLQSIEIPEGVTSLGINCFNDCYGLTSVTLPSTLEYIGDVCFSLQSMNEMMPIAEIICNAIVPPVLGNDIFGPWDGYEEWDYEEIDPSAYVYNGVLKVPAQSLAAYREAWGEYFPNIEPLADYVSNTNGLFNNNATWGEESDIDFDGKTIYIKKDHTVTLNSELVLEENTTLINDGVLVIEQGGELVVETVGNILGVVKVETPELTAEQWHIIGAPFNGYAFSTLENVGENNNLSVTEFNYANCSWDQPYGVLNDMVGKGEGFFAYSWSNTKQTFSTVGGNWGEDITTTPTTINMEDFEVRKTLGGNNGHWMALANPYTFKLDIAKFLQDQGTAIQGGVSYRLSGNTWQTVPEGAINVTEGFFVNFVNAESQTAYFKTTQRYTSSAKANTEREFVRLAMLDGERSVELLFAQNDDANESYDIYDANKLFSPAEIAEPYFLTDGIALVKEEVNTLPYYATMNVRSYEGKEVKFKADYIPEGLSVSIIDGEEIVDLTEGAEYTTEIASGENANRFKVLVKNNVGLADMKELDVTIANSNRHIAITAQEEVKIEVYNTLGQKVYETNETDFVLSGVASGAYVVKVQGAKAAKSQKIIVE